MNKIRKVFIMNQIQEILKLNKLEESIQKAPRHQLILDEDFKNQYLKKFIQRMIMDNPELNDLEDAKKAEEATKRALAIAKLDPTFKGREMADKDALNQNQGSYFDWLIRLINKGAVKYDEMIQGGHEYADQLKAFDDQKKRNRLPSDKKDIMQFKSLEELMDMLMER